MIRAVANVPVTLAGEVTLRLPMPRYQGPADETPTVPLLERWRAARNRSAEVANGAARPGGVNWSRDRVREIIDGDGPIPCGLDRESIEAARRIARHLARRWNR